MDNFADHPVSITEARSNAAAENAGRVWTPRDALISLLREIDSGQVCVDDLIICFSTTDEHIRYKQATASLYRTLGIMEACKIMMLKD